MLSTGRSTIYNNTIRYCVFKLCVVSLGGKYIYNTCFKGKGSSPETCYDIIRYLNICDVGLIPTDLFMKGKNNNQQLTFLNVYELQTVFSG